MNKLNNQRCSLHSILLSLSILLTLLFIATCTGKSMSMVQITASHSPIGTAADVAVAAELRESGNLTKPVRKFILFVFLFFFIFGK